MKYEVGSGMWEVIVVKLGGSAITDKKSPVPKLRAGTLRRLAAEIAEFLKSSRQAGRKVIIVHGAGSFGHPLAKKYRLSEGAVEGIADVQKKGFALTQASVRLLNVRVMAALQDAGVNAVSVPPGTILKCKGGKIGKFDAKKFSDYLGAGFVPVTFGDAILDEKKRFCICSGDLLAEELARKFKPEKVVFVADVDGIFDRDPRDSDAKLLKEIKCGEMQGSILPEFGARGPGFGARPESRIPNPDSRILECIDVTGGMKGKLESVRRIAAHGVPVFVLNGRKPGRLLKALLGEKTICTKFVP